MRTGSAAILSGHLSVSAASIWSSSRVDRCSIAFRIGTAKATREARHLAKLFDERLQTADPGFGIEAAMLIASKVEPLSERQIAAKELARDEADNVDLSRLVDRLSTRLGPKRVYRLAPVESRVPERTMKRIPALAPLPDANWPEDLPRPARLLDPPEPVTATALLPDHPPAFFVWRKVRHRVVRADGPERITGEWWKSEREHLALRDYYRVETRAGRALLALPRCADRRGRTLVDAWVLRMTYAELQVTTHFSFLRGASSPRETVRAGEAPRHPGARHRRPQLAGRHRAGP